MSGADSPKQQPNVSWNALNTRLKATAKTQKKKSHMLPCQACARLTAIHPQVLGTSVFSSCRSQASILIHFPCEPQQRKAEPHHCACHDVTLTGKCSFTHQGSSYENTREKFYMCRVK